MKEAYRGIAISLLFHGLIIGGIFSVAARSPLPLKVVSLDFAILKEEAKGPGIAAARPNAAKAEKKEVLREAPKMVAEKEPVQPRREAAPVVEAPPREVAARGIVSDPQSQVVIPGIAARSQEGKTVLSAQGRGPVSTGSDGGANASGSETKILNYVDGGRAERDYQYIREGVMRNVRYPERARRMGWEGKVLLSFMVLETGTIRDIKVMQSSGFPSLDENAREAVAKTVFSKKNSHRLLVTLPVEYRIE